MVLSLGQNLWLSIFLSVYTMSQVQALLTVVAHTQNGLTDEKRTVKLLGGKQTEGT